ncbi:MAG: hypothetical protein ACE5OW_07525 [Candidatus Bathyarchaeia archaeon]
MKTKKAVIVILLVEESKEIPNKEIEKEIREELSKGWPRIPWCKRVERVTVSETQNSGGV